ncbi:MAG: hypothetical protein AUG75_04045 [Cyanobacteria bacterium 13_1_20CM_4_61_6]|nr:MAG: hypothetical protein AUG75_04045 [Cyanobacteria bacterium 13_1_20CM_4_61_6]
MDTLLADLRYALRQLARSPGFTAVAVLTLALGAGTNSLLFSVIHAVLLRPLPYPDPDRIVSIGLVPRDNTIGRMDAQATHWAYFEWGDDSRSFTELAAYISEARAIVGGGSAPEDMRGAEVTARFFPLFGVQPALGRTFMAEEQAPTGPPVVLLSHGLWQERFGGDRSAVGRTVIMDGAPVTIVGVLPASFDFPSGARFWRPLRLPRSGGQTTSGNKTTVFTFFVHVVGRLASGVSITQARTELTGLLSRSSAQPPFLRDGSVDVVSLHERLYGNTRPLLLILLGAVGFVLLIACANVASLLVARAARREREFAIRAALGGGRLRLARQLLAESMVLAILGAAAGLVVPTLGLPLFMHAAPLRAVEAVDVHLNTAVLAFTTGLALITGVAFGLAPALTASRPNLVVGLKSGAGQAGTAAHRARLRSGLVVAELAAALVLLMGAGLLARSLLQLLAVDLGFRADHVVGVRMGRLSKSWFLQGHARSEFYGAVRERLAALPGVASVALTDVLPLGGIARSSTVRVDDAPPGSVDVSLRAVSADYFKAVEATVIAGRDFTLADRSDAAPVAVVNAAFARELLHGSDPVGHQVWAGGPSRTIVGEVKDVPQLARDVPAAPEVFFPAAQGGEPPRTIVVRTKVDPAGLVATIRRTVQEVDPDQPAQIFTLAGELAKSAAPRRDSAVLLGAFALVAMVLAAVGLAGVIAYLVAHRTHEIGVRVALGAGRGDVLRLVVGDGARLVAVGVVIGLVGAVAVTRVLSSLLYGVTATDPVTFLVVPLVLVVVALGAAAVPARRATRVDPVVALRYE